MPRRVEIPGNLLGHPFSIADAGAQGLSPERLRGRDLSAPYRGVRVVGAAPPDASARIAAFAAGMAPEQFFSHSTAALIMGLPLPQSLAQRHELHVSVVAPQRAPRQHGVSGHQLRPHAVTAGRWLDYHVADPFTVWRLLAAQLGVYDLIAVGDHLIAEPYPVISLETIAERLDQAARLTGTAALRRAAARIRLGSESRLETWTRLILVDGGLPEPVLNQNAFSDSGEFLGRIDLSYPPLRIAIEYEGEQHRVDRRQFDHDIDRLDLLTENGWRVVRVRSTHVFSQPTEVVRRVEAALSARGWRR